MAMSISPENEKLLNDVVASGQFKNQDDALAEALRLLRHNNNGTDINLLPRDQWITEFNAWVSSMPRGNPHADLRRETVYEGRGE